MWMLEVFSEGDLCNDGYLCSKTDEWVKDPEYDDGGYFTDIPRFCDGQDIDNRIDLITSAINRLAAEKELLQKYGEKLIYSTTWNDVLNK